MLVMPSMKRTTSSIQFNERVPGYSTNKITSFDSLEYAIFSNIHVEFRWHQHGGVAFSKCCSFLNFQYLTYLPPQSIQVEGIDETSNRRSVRYRILEATEWYLY